MADLITTRTPALAGGIPATVETISGCRSCRAVGLEHILSLGDMPLANELRTAEQMAEQEVLYPLDLALCPQCALVQITATVPPERLFREYLYFSSYSDTLVRHAADLVASVVDQCGLNSESLAIELASNDGYLLQHFAERGIPVLGIDPAANVTREAVARGIPTLCEFFGQDLAQRLKEDGRAADVIIANNVLAHVADLNGFVAGIGILLNHGGRAVIEVPYLINLIERCEFDTIYHEHLCYFSLTALDRLFRRHGLWIVDVETVAIHGGSLRIWVAHAGERQPAVRALLEEETVWDVADVRRYRRFRMQVERIRDKLREQVETLRRAGQRLAGYGATAKATVLLNYCGARGWLDFVVDRSPHKQGRFIPGVRVPVLAPERLLEVMPDCTLLLAWNIADEVLAQQAEYRRRGGKFLIPIPEPTVV